jgi:hypothetical protein
LDLELRRQLTEGFMRSFFLLFLGAIILPAAASAGQVQHADWAAAQIGNRCHVYSVRSAPDTSGTLIFSFSQGGYNASFEYEYRPWPGETETPWDEDDLVVLEVDDTATWLGDEMFPHVHAGGDILVMTGGFVPDMVLQMMSAQSTVGVALERAAHGGEVWLYGQFATAGFAESLAEAAAWCDFNPRNLPRS